MKHFERLFAPTMGTAILIQGAWHFGTRVGIVASVGLAAMLVYVYVEYVRQLRQR